MERNKKQNIVFLTDNSFPVGLAGTNRLLSYSLGMIENGFESHVLCIRPTETVNHFFNKESKGNYKGINFTYPGNITIRVTSFCGRRFNDLKSICKSLIHVWRLLKTRQVYFFIVYGNSLFFELTSLMLSKMYGIMIVKEENENPYIYKYKNFHLIDKLYRWIYLRIVYHLYDGLLVMTNPLKYFFNAIGVNENKTLVVPQIIDMTRFEVTNNENSLFYMNEYIAYAGSLKDSKDGILLLVKAFLLVKEKYSSVKLFIAGDGTKAEIEVLESLIKRLDLSENVRLLGRLSSEEIPYFYAGAEILVSCRPTSFQAEYGFPTKIVEYLASGRPIVTTATGDLAKHVLDKVNIFLSPSAEPIDFGATMVAVLEDKYFSENVAKNGKILAVEKFNASIYTRKIINFINRMTVPKNIV